MEALLIRKHPAESLINNIREFRQPCDVQLEVERKRWTLKNTKKQKRNNGFNHRQEPMVETSSIIEKIERIETEENQKEIEVVKENKIEHEDCTKIEKENPKEIEVGKENRKPGKVGLHHQE